MPSLPTRSWCSFSEGFLPPEKVVQSAKTRGVETLVFSDAGDISAVPEILKHCSQGGLGAIVGIEFDLVWRGKMRRASVFARGKQGIGELFSFAAGLSHPLNPSRPKGELLPGEECDLPVGTVDQLGGGLVVVSGGRGSLFEDCRARGDVDSFLDFVDDVRKRGAGVAAGYDPGMSDPRDGAFVEGVKKHRKPVAILPWRWTVCEAGQEELFHSSTRSVFGKSPDPTVLRVGAAFGTMNSLDSDFFSVEEIAAFSKITRVSPGELPEGNTHKDLPYVDRQNKTLTQQEACSLLKQRAEKNLDAMIQKAGLKGSRGAERRKIYQERIDKEVQAIAGSGVAGRILYVSDLMEFCRRKGIKAMTRGSAANSLICYLNKISPVNPVTFDLPSERFINPKRRNSPDIDIDVAASRAGEARDFLCGAGMGGVNLRSAVSAGFVDILQRELRSAGIPYAHELRERMRNGMGGKRIPNTYAELEAEYQKFASRSRDGSGENLHSFIASRLSGVNPETIESAIQTAKALEGRPVYNVDHVGVAMRTSADSQFVPLLESGAGKKVLAVDHDRAEAFGFAKIDILSRRALDMADRIQANIEKNGGKAKSMASVFSLNKKAVPELRRGLVGGLDQIGSSGKGQIPHRQLLSSWDEDFTNIDLVNYLALVRYGTQGWGKGGKPEGEMRPRMVALYCGSMASGHALEKLGEAVSKKAEGDLEAGRNLEFWKNLGNLGRGGEESDKEGPSELLRTLEKLPLILAHTESLGGADVGGKLLARITWREGGGNKKSHLALCEDAIRDARRGNGSKMKKILSSFYGIEPENPVFESVCDSLSSGKAIQRPEYITGLGPHGVAAWDKVTSPTRGLLLFQEQVTELLCLLSGCDYATCDLVRDAIAHRGRDIPDEVKEQIFSGIKSNTGGDGGLVLKEFTEDAPYLFNKGHASVYAGFISWQLDAKRNWPASYCLGYIEHLRAAGVKISDVRESIGAVLGDAQALGCGIDTSELPERARSEAVDKGGGSVLKIGLDAFLGISAGTVKRWENLAPQTLKSVKRLAAAEDLCKPPFSLPPEDAEIVFSLTKGGGKTLKTFYKSLGLIPEGVQKICVGEVGQAVPGEELNFYKPSNPKVSNVWGFVLGAPQVVAGQGKRPCRVNCRIGKGDGRVPLDVSYLFWQERGKESGGFLPKEAVELQSRLNSFHQRNIPISTVVRLNDFFGRWDGSVTTIKPVGNKETISAEAAPGGGEGGNLSKGRGPENVPEAGNRGKHDRAPKRQV